MNTNVIEKLDNSNYDSWKILMKSVLIQCEQWNIASGVTIRSDTNAEKFDMLDQKALSTIILGVTKSQLIHIKNCKTSSECWKKLETVHKRTGPSRKVTLFKNLVHAHASDKTISEHIENFSDVVEKLSELEIIIPDEVLSILLLCSLPKSYENFIVAMESRDLLPSFDSLKAKIAEEDLRRKINLPVTIESADTGAFFTSKYKGKTHKNVKIKCFKCGKLGHKSFQCKKDNDDLIIKNKIGKDKKAFGAAEKVWQSCEISKNDWFIDSGATNHMTPYTDNLNNIGKSAVKEINTANNQKMKVEGVGDSQIHINGHDIEIKNVLLVPNLSANLLSVSEMVKNKNTVMFDKRGCIVLGAENEILANAAVENGAYKLQSQTASCMLAKESSQDLLTWHRRLGHLNFNDLNKMKNGVIDGIQFNGSAEAIKNCQVCLEGKQSRKPFKKGNKRREKLLELIHSDVCGPMETKTFGKSQYFVTFIDDHSRKIFIYLMKNKYEVIDKFKEFKEMVENQLERKIKILRSDNGTEYLNNEFKRYCIENGIKHQTSNVYTPQQNGLAERANRTIVERAKCMLFDAKLPKIYWGEAVNTAVHVINRCVNYSLKNDTPEGVWTGKRLNVNYLKIFGSNCMVHVPKEKRSKWDKKSTKMIFVGYSDTSKGYRCLDPKTCKITTSRDVVFIENNESQVTQINHSIINNDIIADEVTTEVKIMDESTEISNVDQDVTYEDVEDFTFVPSILSQDSDNDESQNNSEGSEISEDKIPIALRKSKRTIKPPKHLSYKAMVDIEEPSDTAEAKSSNDWPKWKSAMKEEYMSLQDNKTWNLVDLPPNRKAIKNKWVFKLKKNEAGEISRFKARLVVKGCSQRFGIDYSETYSPVVRYSTIRYLMGLAAKLDLDINQMDAITAFLQSDLNEDIYMAQPEEFDDNTGRVCKLNKAIYGLKQASRSWNNKLNKILLQKGYRKSKLDPCVYIKTDRHALIIITIYVDDILIFSNNEKLKTEFKTSMMNNFKMKDIGNAKNCVGLTITRNRKEGKIWLDQELYIKDILKRFNMSDCNTISNPLDTNVKLSREMCPNTEQEKLEMKSIPYQEAVGSLLYLVQGTRPDLTFAISKVSQFNNNPGKAHWQAVKRILRYVKGTSHMKLEFSKKSNSKITGYSDSDWGGDLDDRKSNTGYVFKMNGGAISWASRKQSTVALSSTEAEYMALTQAIQEAMWLKQLDEDLFEKKSEPIIIHCDNSSAIQLANNDGYHARTKHIDIKHHFCRQKLQDGFIILEHINTKEMVADSMTKSVTKEKYQFCAREMGLKVQDINYNVK